MHWLYLCSLVYPLLFSVLQRYSTPFPYPISICRDITYIYIFSEVKVMCNFLFSFSSFHRLILILWLFVPSTRIDYYCSPHTRQRRRTNTHTHANREHTHTQIASDSQNFMRSKSIESIKFAMYVFILCLILSREHVDNSMPPLLLPMGVCSCVYLWFVLFVRNVILWLYECATIIIMTISSCQGTNEGHAKHNARKYVNRKW